MPDQPSPIPWRHRLRLSVRALIALVMAIGVFLGWYVRTVQVQQDAVAAIKKAGGAVAYDWEWGNHNPDIINPNGKPRAQDRIHRGCKNLVLVSERTCRPPTPIQTVSTGFSAKKVRDDVRCLTRGAGVSRNMISALRYDPCTKPGRLRAARIDFASN